MALIIGNNPNGQPVVDQQASAAAASQMPYADPNYAVPVAGPYPTSWKPPTAAEYAAAGIADPNTATNTAVVDPGAPPAPPAPPRAKPNYSELIQNDPNYMQTINDYNAQLSRAGAEKDAALKALEYAFRGNPTYSTQAQYNRNLANVESEYQRNIKNLESEYQYNRGNTQFDAERALGLAMRALAARNALTSGEKPWAQEDNQIALQRALHGLDYTHGEQRHQYDYGHTQDVYGLKLGEFQSEQQYADAVAAAQKNYLAIQDEVARAKRQAAIDAANSLAQNPLYQY